MINIDLLTKPIQIGDVSLIIGARGKTGAQGIQGEKGDKGDQGIQGAQGIQGIQGEQGIQGVKGDKGDKGDTGNAATIAVGNVTTGTPTTPASVTNTGTQNAATFDFIIPQGIKGDKGDKGDPGLGSGDMLIATYDPTGKNADAFNMDNMDGDLAETKITFTDVTTGNANTTKHGFAPKAVAPSSGRINVVGIGYGDTEYSLKGIFDSTAPTTQVFGDVPTVGTLTTAARRDHKHGMPPNPSDASITITDVTTNNADATKHGFMPKLPNDTTKFLRGDGQYAVIPASGGLYEKIRSITDALQASTISIDLSDINYDTWESIKLIGEFAAGNNGTIILRMNTATSGYYGASHTDNDTTFTSLSDRMGSVSASGITTVAQFDIDFYRLRREGVYGAAYRGVIYGPTTTIREIFGCTNFDMTSFLIACSGESVKIQNVELWGIKR